MKLPLLTAATLLLALAISSSSADKLVQVTTPSGPIVGERITAEYRDISRFLGVPYAQAPVGKLRFRKPLPVSKWSSPLKAVNWPANCYQNFKQPLQGFVKPLMIHDRVSEDCLYANIWSPKVEVEGEDKLKPVIVWIHGGALLFGSSVLSWYDGEVLAARADAVVVTINYRLGTLGFLYSDEVGEVKGNQGLWDQTMALEWIQENIKYFGGDPNRVTIAGNSAGAWSVSAHVLSPASRKLFQKAILLSGATINSKVAVEPKEAVERWLTGIRTVGCATESDRSISQKIVECLEALDVEKLDTVAYHTSHGPGELPPLMVVDGQFLPERPIDLLASGNYKTDVQLLVDTVTDEGSFMFLGHPQFSAQNPEKITLDEAKDFFFKALADNVDQSTIPVDAISKVYFDKLNGDNQEDDLYRRQVAIAFGDFLLGCPELKFAKEVFRNAPKTAQVYQWYYTAKLGRNKILDGKWTSTAHTDDIYAFFGMPFKAPKWFTNRERDISREVIQFVGAFIRTGAPGVTHTEWQSYFMAPDGEEVIAPYYEIGARSPSAYSYKYNLKHVECDLIWNKLKV